MVQIRDYSASYGLTLSLAVDCVLCISDAVCQLFDDGRAT